MCAVEVGFEAHVYEKGDKINPAVLQDRLNDLKKRGLKARISEMDVYSDDGLRIQADQYSRVFRVCFSNPNCVAFTTWGVSDRYDMWQDNNHQLHYGRDFLWDKKSRPTLAEAAIKDYLKNRGESHHQ